MNEDWCVECKSEFVDVHELRLCSTCFFEQATDEEADKYNEELDKRAIEVEKAYNS